MDELNLASGLLTALVLACVGCAWLILLNRSQSRDAQTALFLVAFFLRFAASVAIYQYGFDAITGDEDSSGWINGLYLQEVWKGRGIGILRLPVAALEEIRARHEGYRLLLATFIQLTGVTGRLPAASLGACCGALTVVFTFRIARELFSPRIALYSGCLACVYPALIVWSAMTIKEPFVLMLETAILYLVVVLRKKSCNLWLVSLTTLLVSVLCEFRYYAGYMAVVTIAPVLARPMAGCRRFRAVLAALVFLLLIVVEFSILEEPQHLGMLNSQRQFHTASFYTGFRESVSIGSQSGSAFNRGFDLHSPFGFAAALLYGSVHLLLAPFPWNYMHASPRFWCTAPEQAFWWCLFFAGVVPGLIHTIRTRREEMCPFLAFYGTRILFYSLMFGNIGLAYRQRSQFLPWLLITAVVGLERSKWLGKIYRRSLDTARSGDIKP